MSILVRVPASIANFGPAFDALAVAITLYNEVELDRADRPSVAVAGEGAGELPADAANLVYRAAAAVADRAGVATAFAVRCHNRIPLRRGLGSSAAAIVGGAVAANEALGRPLDRQALLALAWQLEGHPDNVAAALLGGAVVTCVADGRLTWTRLEPAWSAALVVAVPSFGVPTAAARQALPAQVPFGDAAANLGRTALLISALLTGRPELLPVAMDDALHQPYRKPLVPGFDRVVAAAREAGAYAAALCGAGPAIVAVAPAESAEAVGRAMADAFAASGSAATHQVVGVDAAGAAARPLPQGTAR